MVSTWYSKLTQEEKRAYSRKQYLKHRDRVLKQTREWAKNNPEKRKEIAENFRKRHPGKMNEYQKEWRKKNPEKSLEFSRKTASKLYYKDHEKSKEKNRLAAKKRRMLMPEAVRDYKKRITLKRQLEIAGRDKPDSCECCGKVSRIVFDHDHLSGSFRGWICDRCNWVLGHVEDSPEILNKLSDYLHKYHPSLQRG